MKKLVTFYTQAGAIRFEKELKKAGKEGRIKPVPRKISSSCGLCVETNVQSLEGMFIEDIESCYNIVDGGFELVFHND